ncbi:hypothetical protein EQM14_12590 [Caproiciproducens sp. NJN-50]|uniref:hypothetical protein n=1 Tax=Acutalibacteraceae TaxID=3082771 RepID=UPI000FFE2193|nr:MULTISPECIES: hypothetical protein [Acutalibacteraceae]QAT50534.1 hypothetical protein EQM14_12590 [Caproiciproducens sp. NJN-50]
MYIFFFILLLISVFLIASFTEPARVVLNLDTDENKLLIRGSWLIQTVSVQFLKKGPCQNFSVFFSDNRVASWDLKSKPKGKRNFFHIRGLSVEQACCNAAYGFRTPFLTGISSGFSLFIQSIVPNISIDMAPDFFSDHAYLVVKAEAKLNLGKTFVNFILKRPAKRSEKYYGSIGDI